MAQIVSFFVTEDEEFKKHIGRLLRSGAIPVSVLDAAARRAWRPTSSSSTPAATRRRRWRTIERLRAGLPGLRASSPWRGWPNPT